MNTEQNTKKCSKCQLVKPFGDFHPNKDGKFGLRSVCKKCDKERSAAYYKTNSEEIQVRQKSKYDDDPSLFSSYRKRCYQKHKQRYIIKNKKWREEHKSYFNTYWRERRENDPDVRILCALRTRITHALHGLTKSDNTETLLGCSPDELRCHLEKLFLDGMSWDNYGFGLGKWNIDHILPCSIFNFSDPIEQKQCFHYTNLQPMWHQDNRKKSDSV